MNKKSSIKSDVHKQCLALAQAKIDVYEAVLKKINEAKTQETKSSAGDKFETSREMLQAEEDRTSSSLSHAILLKKSLEQINPEIRSKKVETGALVIGSKINYYISVGLGKIELNGIKYYAISLSSPIAKVIRGKMKGESFSFNGIVHSIEEIL